MRMARRRGAAHLWRTAPEVGLDGGGQAGRAWLPCCLLGVALLSAGCEPAAQPGDPMAGQALYSARCQACHGAQGETPTNGDAGVIANLSGDSVSEVLQRYRDPPDGAPWWTGLKSGLTEREIRDLAASFPLRSAPSAGR